MDLGEPALVELIRRRIRSDGPASFRWFMEQALYHPEHGYYSSGRATIGRRGDYFTNVVSVRSLAESWPGSSGRCGKSWASPRYSRLWNKERTTAILREM